MLSSACKEDGLRPVGDRGADRQRDGGVLGAGGGGGDAQHRCIGRYRDGDRLREIGRALCRESVGGGGDGEAEIGGAVGGRRDGQAGQSPGVDVDRGVERGCGEGVRSVAQRGPDRDIADGDGGDGLRPVGDRGADRQRDGGVLGAGGGGGDAQHRGIGRYRDGDRLRGGGGGLAVGVAGGGGDRDAESTRVVCSRRDGQAGESRGVDVDRGVERGCGEGVRSVAQRGPDRDIADGDGGDGLRPVGDRGADLQRDGGLLGAGLFPYTTLFRSIGRYRDGDRLRGGGGGLAVGVAGGGGD